MTYFPSSTPSTVGIAGPVAANDTFSLSQAGHATTGTDLATLRAFLFGATAATGSTGATGVTGSIGPAGATFFEDFTGTSVDWTKWNPEYGYSSAALGSVDGSAFRVDPRSPPYPGANPFSLSNSVLRSAPIRRRPPTWRRSTICRSRLGFSTPKGSSHRPTAITRSSPKPATDPA